MQNAKQEGMRNPVEMSDQIDSRDNAVARDNADMRDLREQDLDARDAILRETLQALDLPERMLKAWFDHNRAFCERHGGRRVYPGLMELLDRCDAALDQRGTHAGGADSGGTP